MSQEKMDRYKAAKANKDQIRKKQKRTKTFTILAWILIPLAVIGLIAWGLYAINHPKTENNNQSNITIDTADTSQYGTDLSETFYNVEDFINETTESVLDETADTVVEETVATEEATLEDADTAEEDAEQSASEDVVEDDAADEAADDTTVNE